MYMKNRFFLAFCLSIPIILFSCKKDKENDDPSSNIQEEEYFEVTLPTGAICIDDKDKVGSVVTTQSGVQKVHISASNGAGISYQYQAPYQGDANTAVDLSDTKVIIQLSVGGGQTFRNISGNMNITRQNKDGYAIYETNGNGMFRDVAANDTLSLGISFKAVRLL